MDGPKGWRVAIGGVDKQKRIDCIDPVDRFVGWCHETQSEVVFPAHRRRLGAIKGCNKINFQSILMMNNLPAKGMMVVNIGSSL